MPFGDGEAGGEREEGSNGGREGGCRRVLVEGRGGGEGGELSDKNKTQPGGKRGREKEGREGRKERGNAGG